MSWETSFSFMCGYREITRVWFYARLCCVRDVLGNLTWLVGSSSFLFLRQLGEDSLEDGKFGKKRFLFESYRSLEVSITRLWKMLDLLIPKETFHLKKKIHVAKIVNVILDFHFLHFIIHSFYDRMNGNAWYGDFWKEWHSLFCGQGADVL